MVSSLWDILPLDLVELILQHRAALLVQRRWWRLTHYAHARRPIWSNVRRHLCAIGGWPALVAFPMVRREWRRESASWLTTDALMVEGIRHEARIGLWGRPSGRLGDDVLFLQPV